MPLALRFYTVPLLSYRGAVPPGALGRFVNSSSGACGSAAWEGGATTERGREGLASGKKVWGHGGAPGSLGIKSRRHRSDSQV